MGNTESSNQAFENAFDPNKNGAAEAFDPNKNGFISNMTDFGGGFITGLEIVGTSALGMLGGGGGGLFGGGGGSGGSGSSGTPVTTGYNNTGSNYLQPMVYTQTGNTTPPATTTPLFTNPFASLSKDTQQLLMYGGAGAVLLLVLKKK